MTLEWILLGFRIIATILLCTFLGLAFYVIWRDLKSVEAGSVTKTRASHHLRLIVPADNGELVIEETLPLQPVTLLGRAPENTVVLGDVSASARHARLSRREGVWWLEDLGSQHGTLLNELPLSKPTPLNEGDIIGIGSLRFRFESVS